MQCEKTLLTVDEFCHYVGIGKTKARELISNPCCKYVVRICLLYTSDAADEL